MLTAAPAHHGSRQPLRLAAAAAAAIAAAAAWGWWAGFEERALLSLPAEDRSRIYARNLDSMRILCGKTDVDGAFEARCREQALFLADFPECGDECRAAIEPHLPRPTR